MTAALESARRTGWDRGYIVGEAINQISRKPMNVACESAEEAIAYRVRKGRVCHAIWGDLSGARYPLWERQIRILTGLEK